MNAQKNAGAGAGGAGRGMGFSMDADRGGGGGGGGRGRGPGGPGGPGRDGGRGGKGGGKGRRDDREGGGASNAGYRVGGELGNLEKALTKNDFGAQKQSLEEILKALRPMKLSSIEQLDMGTRGKMITTLLRVSRQQKPAEVAAAEAAPGAEVAPVVEAPAADAPAADAPAADAALAAEAAPADAAPAADGAPAEAAPAAEAPKAEEKPAEESKLTAWQDVQYLVGSIWRSVSETDRADASFTASGREFKERAEEKKAAPSEKPARKGDKPEASPLEKGKRTRDSARVKERNGQFADAARLYEEAGDLKSALANAVFAKIEDVVDRLMGLMKQPEWQGVLEKAGEWERLMGIYVKRADFESVAKLYERAKQFDQAGLAWERAGKLSVARKLYERAKDTTSANRVRDLEVKKLIERGDRLGAATIQMASGKKAEAIETVKGLAGPKAYRFLQKLKLDDEAKTYAAEEIAKAVAENKVSDHARWLELTGEAAGAAEMWIKAERKDKALPLYEQLSDWPKAAGLAETLGLQDKAVELFTKAGDKENADRVAAMPKPLPQPKPPKDAADDAVEAAADAPADAPVDAPADAPVDAPENAAAPEAPEAKN